MRVISGGWLYALLLCWAGMAMGQSVAGNVSAAEDATDAFAVESSVSAGVASTVDSAAITSGSGSRSAAAAALNLLAGAKSPAASPNGRPNPSITQLELYGMRRGEAQRGLKTSLLAGPGVHLKSAGAGNHSRVRVPTAGTHQEKKPGIPGSQSSAAGGAVSSSAGFPDSTRGTAGLSPPDPGTESPLDWTANDLNFGLPDFSERQFLNPSLQTQTGGKRYRARQTLAGRARKAPGQAPSGPSTEQTLEPDILSNQTSTPDIDQTLTPDILKQSSAPPTIEEQLGLPQ